MKKFKKTFEPSSISNGCISTGRYGIVDVNFPKSNVSIESAYLTVKTNNSMEKTFSVYQGDYSVLEFTTENKILIDSIETIESSFKFNLTKYYNELNSQGKLIPPLTFSISNGNRTFLSLTSFFSKKLISISAALK